MEDLNALRCNPFWGFHPLEKTPIGESRLPEPLIIYFILLFLVSGLGAQERKAPYLIPQTVFVGDRARLVIPLGSGFQEAESIIITKPEELPGSRELLIHRIELERRGGNARFLIDFTAFAPGFIPLPSLKLPALESVFLLSTGLTIPIASILEGNSLVLSDPVPPLALPGTAFLLYGGLGIFFLLPLAVMGVQFWGRGIFQQWGVQFRRRRYIRRMGKVIRGVQKDLAEGSLREGEALTWVSAEFRTFLSVFTEMPCQAMAAGEFARISLPETEDPPHKRVLSGDFLCGIFRRCDTLRFRGTPITSEELAPILEEIQRFIDALYGLEKKGDPHASLV